MKKKLEAELISIAHRILKLKNKSDLNQLHQETQKLYEKLSVLKFVEENFGDVKPTIGIAEIQEKIDTAFDTVAEPEVATEALAVIPEMETVAEPELIIEEEAITEEESETNSDETTEDAPAEPIAESETTEPESEKTEEAPVEEEPQHTETEAIEEIPAAEEEIQPEQQETEKPKEEFFKPAFELSFDPKGEEAKEEEVKEDAKEEFKTSNTQITFEDILGSSYVDPVFVKPEDLEKERETAKPDNVIPIGRSFSDNSNVISLNKNDETRPYSLNDRLSKGITIGLNDRVAFMKHLFANSSEDYNRVLSQLMTFDTFAEAQSFIDQMVKPDYNNWEGKDEYAERFMEIVEKKFS